MKTNVSTLTMRIIIEIVEELENTIKTHNETLQKLSYQDAVNMLKCKSILDSNLTLGLTKSKNFRTLIYKNYISITVVSSSDGLLLDKAAIQVMSEVISYDYCKKQLNDLSLKEQENFLIGLDLKPLETAISNYLGIKINFSSDLYLPTNKSSNLSPKLSIYSQDLKEYCGILSSQYKEIKLETFGRVSFYISKDDGLQHISFPDIHYAWTYNDGGSNGHIAFNVKYDFRSNSWDINQVK